MILKLVRKKKGYRQVDLAEILSISVRHYQRIEAGVTFPNESTINNLEDLFQLPQRVLFLNITDVEKLPDFYQEHIQKVRLVIN